MTKAEIKLNCEKYLRASYEYYILGAPTMLDSDFDKLEKQLRNTGDALALKVVNFVDFPNIREIKELGLNTDKILDYDKKDETYYKHLTPMLSLQKIMVEDEKNMPIHELELFFDRIKAKSFECSPKMDGNGIEVIYKNNKLFQGLTRGDKSEGLDKTSKLKHIVPNEIMLDPNFTWEVRGELVIDVKLWEKKYSDPNKVDNPRNFIAGLLTNESYSVETMNELVFVAYSLVKINEKTGEVSYIDNTQAVLRENGFNYKYDPFTIEISGVEDFKDMYYKFKNYRDNLCPYLLDGIVIKYPESLRAKLGQNNHHPKWACAIKFPPVEVSTTINHIDWELGKDGHMCPVGILEPVELGGTVVSRVSLHNIGYIINNKVYPGARISLVKSGEIIPMVRCIINESPDTEKYFTEFKNFSNSF